MKLDILSQYYDTLSKLKNLHFTLFNVPYCKRDLDRIRVLEDEIKDVEFAIRGMENGCRDRFCYVPPSIFDDRKRGSADF